MIGKLQKFLHLCQEAVEAFEEGFQQAIQQATKDLDVMSQTFKVSVDDQEGDPEKVEEPVQQGCDRKKLR